MSESSDPLPPCENDRFTGHAEVEAALLKACRANRLHHSLLLCGPKGIGKATLAYRLARYLLKPEEGGLLGLAGDDGDDFNMSADNPTFRQIAAGGHPSLRVVARAVNPDTGKVARDITVADIRSLSDFYRMTSADGNWRVAIIDAADDMNPNAANALLKVLEEPPAKSVIILVAHSPGRLLATIRSRCHVIPFGPLAAEEMAEILDRQTMTVAEEDLALLMQLSGGSVGDAALIMRRDGLELYREIEALIARPRKEVDTELEAFSDRLAKNGQDELYELFTHLMERALSDRIVKSARDGSVPAPGGELDRWLDVWEKVRALFAQARGLGLDRKHVILNAFLHTPSATRGHAAP